MTDLIRIKANANVLGLKPGDVVDVPGDDPQVRGALEAQLVERVNKRDEDATTDEAPALDPAPDAPAKPPARRRS